MRTSGGGGAGVFAVFAAAGLVCFVNYHAVMRPMRTPPRTGSVQYESAPATPEYSPEVSPPYVVPPPPPSYPMPTRSKFPTAASRRPAPQAPAFQIPTTPGAPVPQWDARYRYEPQVGPSTPSPDRPGERQR